MAEITDWREVAGHGGGHGTAAMLGMLAVLALAGCSSFGGSGGSTAPPSAAAPPPPSSDSSFASRVKSLFSGSSTSLAAAPSSAATPSSAAASAPEVECPPVEYRLGAGALTVNAPNVDNSALSVRFQGSFLQTARECVVRSGQLNVKVGVQGRIVVGPAGGPGPITVPVRYALVREGLEPRTVWTKLFMVPVTIQPGEPNTLFTHVEEEMTVPLPSAVELDAYVIYVGFDPDGAAPAKPPPKAKPKSKTAARTP